MISFYDISFMGRLGNQMFQYAGLRGIAAYKGYQYSLPDCNFDLLDCFKIPKTPLSNNKETIYANNNGFDLEFFNNCPDNINIHGFFQSEKYFKHIENEIRKDFTFKDNIKQSCIIYFDKLNIKKEYLAIHIRRQDYLEHTNCFANLDLNYYKNALDYFSTDIPVIVFSDDPKWCSEQSFFKEKRFMISKLNSQFLDLCAMSMCDYHIIANSSYSWWGSWLAKSKKTIAPKQWYAGEYEHLSTTDLYLSNWIVI